MGGREAAVDRGGGGGAAAGHGGARQDPLHLALPHRRLLLGGQGIYSPITSRSSVTRYDASILAVDLRLLVGGLPVLGADSRVPSDLRS